MATLKRGHRPSTENRGESVELLWDDLRRDLPASVELLKSLSAIEQRNFAERKLTGIGAACWQRGNQLMKAALVALKDRQGDGAERLREAVALMYWGAEILQHQRAAGAIEPDVADSFLLERIWLHGLAAGGGAAGIADWTAAYLSGVFSTGDGDGGILELGRDSAFRVFFGYLMKASVHGRWPNGIDRITTRAYGDLLARADDAAGFRKALVSFCDYRVAQAFGYDGMEATRRRPGSRTESVLDAGGWIRLFPVELLSLQYVYRKNTGGTLSLDADHPLLAAPLMELPSLLPLYEDDFIRRALALAKEVLGSAWRPAIS